MKIIRKDLNDHVQCIYLFTNPESETGSKRIYIIIGAVVVVLLNLFGIIIILFCLCLVCLLSNNVHCTCPEQKLWRLL